MAGSFIKIPIETWMLSEDLDLWYNQDGYQASQGLPADLVFSMINEKEKTCSNSTWMV